MLVQTNVDDATVTVTAGHNQDASLVLTDPRGDPEDASYDSNRVRPPTNDSLVHRSALYWDFVLF